MPTTGDGNAGVGQNESEWASNGQEYERYTPP